MRHTSIIRMVLGLLALLSLSFACDVGVRFDDSTTMLIKKPMILSVVLDPPEAEPGQAVHASYLAADEHGVMLPEETLQLWSAIEPGSLSYGGISISTDGDGENPMEGLEDAIRKDPRLIMPEYEFQVAPKDLFRFNENGMATQQVMLLMIAGGDLTPTDFITDYEGSMAKLQELLMAGQTRQAFRSLVVSEREQQNKNPRITRIWARSSENGQEVSVPFISSDKTGVDRQTAADHPYIFPLCEYSGKDAAALYFRLEVEDEGDVSKDVLYLWASIAGTFKGQNEMERKWEMPGYRFTDEEVKSIVDENIPFCSMNDASSKALGKAARLREDLNLYPIWVMSRDTAVEGQLGQSWAEFYVRLTIRTPEIDTE